MKKYIVNTLLVAVVFLVLAVMLVLHTFYPAMNLPALDIPTFCALSLVALVLEYYLVGKQSRCYPVNFLLGAAVFGLLPLMAGFSCIHHCWKLALVGGVVFGVNMLLFDSITHRLSSGPKAKAAAAVSAMALYLAFQVFSGMFI
jgi:hypothetical protein